MTLPVALAVRIKSSRIDRYITRDVQSLSFRSTAPGGFASATFSLHRRLTFEPEELEMYAQVFVYDARNATVIWEGRIEDIGRTAGSDGEQWQISALGSAAHAKDRTVPLIYIDNSLERWTESPYGQKKATTGIGEVDSASDAACVDLGVPQGTDLTAGDMADMIYRGLYEVNQTLARVRCNWTNGSTSTNVQNRIVTRIGYGSGTVAATQDWNTASTAQSTHYGSGGSLIGGHDVVSLRIWRDAATPAGGTGSNTWAKAADVLVRARVYQTDGTINPGPYLNNYVTADGVVTDLLGRLLTKYTAARIDACTHQIDQLAYPDAVTPADILDDLMMLEPAFYWAAWESNDAGRYRFEWKAWPTTVRYEASTEDGFSSNGSGEGLYNVVKVRWRDPKGRVRRQRRTQTVPELDAAGLTRTAFIDLGDDVGSASNANRVGDQFLAEHLTPPNAGTLTVARTILDLYTDRMVSPWEIVPGELIRVRGLRPNINSLNATTRDGQTVYKIVENNCSGSESRLELDSYPRTVARALAELKKRRFTRRR